MRRRELLTGAMGTAALAGGASAEAAAPERLGPAELELELEQLRRDLDALQDAPDLGVGDVLRGQAGSNRADDPEIGAATEQLVRSTMRTLVIAETVSSLPPANRSDDAVLALVGEHAAEMEYAFQGQLAVVQGLGRADRKAVRDALRADPTRAFDLGERLDGIATGSGVPRRRRSRLKGLVKHTTWRLQRQPLDAVVDELADSAAKQADLSSPEVAERLRPHVEGRARVERWNGELRRLRRALGQAEIPLADEVPGDPNPRSERLMRIAKTELTISAVLAGIGSLMVGVGVALADGGGAVLIILGLFPLTGFVVLLIIGLVTLGIALGARNRERSMR